MKKFKDVDSYIDSFSGDCQSKLKELRKIIRSVAPKSEEIISYGIPAYKYNGVLVYFAGYKNHIGFYPTSSGITKFKKELSKYKTSKGTVQFPISDKLPIGLISKIVKFRLCENKHKVK